MPEDLAAAKMSQNLASQSLRPDSQQAHWILVTGSTCPICVSKFLQNCHEHVSLTTTSSHCAWLSSTGEKFAARRGGAARHLPVVADPR